MAGWDSRTFRTARRVGLVGKLRYVRIVVCVVLVSLLVQQAQAGWITGQGRFEKIATNPSAGYVYLYEWDLFVCPSQPNQIGPSRRLGAPPGQPPRGDGYYRVDGLPAGRYCLYVNQPDFFACPKVVPDVTVPADSGVVVNIELDVDYSTYFQDTAHSQWTDWQWTWYQTFRATGTSVRGVSWKMAGAGLYRNTWAEVAILEDNGDPDVRAWKLLGAKTNNALGADADNWVRWPSGQIPITPGKNYAVRIWVNGGCAIYKRDKDSASYPFGRAYDHNGSARNFDLNITVFVDRNNQMVTHTRLKPGPGAFVGSLHDTRWGQSFVAKSTALAAVDVFAASADENFYLIWKVRRGGPDGPQIGPTKITRGAYFASSTDLIGVGYNPDEVPLLAGQTYYIELSNPAGFTPYVQEPDNSYPDGAAFRAGHQTGYDLAMTIVEYGTARPARSPDLPDLSGDKRVDFLDYATFSNQWHASGYDLSADFDYSCLVDAMDLFRWTNYWLRRIGPIRR